MCPVCFTGADAVTRETLNAGIGVLLGVTVIVLGLFARFFVQLARRSRAAAHLVGLEGRPGDPGQGRPGDPGQGRPEGRPLREDSNLVDGKGRPSGRPDTRRVA